MKITLTEAHKVALKHMGIVFLYSGISSVLPLGIALLENDPRWAVLIPVINAVWYSVRRYLQETKQVV